jgi:hypothetical protein
MRSHKIAAIKASIAQILQACYNIDGNKGLIFSFDVWNFTSVISKPFEWALTFNQITAKSFVQRVADAFRAPAFAPVAV